MTNTIVLRETEVDARMAEGWTGLRLERGPNATNLAAFSLVTQIPYVADQTVYTFSDSTGATSDWYRTARYGPPPTYPLGSYSPAWPVAIPPTTTAAPARRSLRACRRMLGQRLQGSLITVTTTADGQLAATSLVSQSGLANQMDPNRYRQWWVMPVDGVSAGQIRHVADQALNPQTGELQVQPAFTSQIVRGTQVELSRLLPFEDMDAFIGLRQCLNLALAECWALDRLPLAGLDQTATYPLDQYGSWIEADAVHEFYGPRVEGWVTQPFGGWDARAQGAINVLDVTPGVAAGAAMEVATTRPGDTLIKRGGVWLEDQQGFVLDDDECLFQPQFIVQVALAHAYECLAGVTTGAAAARFAAKASDQRIIANKAKYSGLPHPVERADHSIPSTSGPWWTWLK